jgi:sarcosine oxidase, subunit beta
MSKRSADAVIIGGGIFGASIGNFLARFGFGELILIEKKKVCSGATAYSAGHVRAHYSNEIGIRLAMRGQELIADAEEWFDGSAGFTPCPYVVLADSSSAPGLEANVGLQRRFGVDTEIRTPAEITADYPYLDLTEVELCSIELSAGYADPLQTVLTIMESAKRIGLTVLEHCEVLEIATNHDRVDKVVTSEGEISTRVVVNAAGPWADRVAAMVGTTYRLALSREHEATFEIPAELDDCPIVSDSLNSMFFRSHGRGELLLGAGYPKELEPCDPDTYDDDASPIAIQGLVQKLVKRLPALEAQLGGNRHESRQKLGWSGVYSISPDWYPIVGEDAVDGYYAAVGGSGHSFKLAPAIGEALASTIAGETPTIDIAPLRPERFAEGDIFTSVWGPGNRG